MSEAIAVKGTRSVKNYSFLSPRIDRGQWFGNNWVNRFEDVTQDRLSRNRGRLLRRRLLGSSSLDVQGSGGN